MARASGESNDPEPSRRRSVTPAAVLSYRRPPASSEANSVPASGSKERLLRRESPQSSKRSDRKRQKALQSPSLVSSRTSTPWNASRNGVRPRSTSSYLV